MKAFSLRQLFFTLFILFVGLLAATALQAWTGPTAIAPGNNVDAPINVGTTDQVKNAGLAVNALSIFGRQYVQTGLNIGTVTANQVVALDVNGTILVGNGGETCQAVTEGAIRYNSTTKGVEFCNGTKWCAVAGCTAPSPVVTYLTSGSSWTVPANWNSSNNTIEAIGGGGGGGAATDVNGGGGGGGGEYRKASNVTLTPSGTVPYSVGAGGAATASGTGGNGGNTSFNTNTVIARGGTGGGGDGTGAAGGSGGTGAAANFNGGNGGTGYPSGQYYSAGGGGAGGAYAAGVAGADANGSGAGAGGHGDGTFGGAGGVQGFGYGSTRSGSPGGNGTEWDSSHGSGGGGGGMYNNDVGTTGGNGGNYGGGGGGSSNNQYSGSGAQGIIVITYTPAN